MILSGQWTNASSPVHVSRAPFPVSHGKLVEIRILRDNRQLSNPDDGGFTWPGGKEHIDKDLSANFDAKLNVTTMPQPDDSGPPAFEPGKPWPGKCKRFYHR